MECAGSGTIPNKMSTGKNVEESLGKAGSKESRSNMSTVQASREIKDCIGLLETDKGSCAQDKSKN